MFVTTVQSDKDVTKFLSQLRKLMAEDKMKKKDKKKGGKKGGRGC